MNDPTMIEPPVQTGHFTRPDVRGFLDFLNSVEGPTMDKMPLDEARLAYLAMIPLGELEPRKLAVIRDLTCPGPAGDIPLRFYDARETREPGPAILFYHGGGFTIGDLDTHHALCTEIAAEMDLPVIAVDYRLAPESPFPAAPDDCEAATRWVAESPAELDRTVTALIPMGDSAGGSLSIVVAQALRDRPAAVPVALQVPIYPWNGTDPSHLSMEDFAIGHFLTADGLEWFAACYVPHPGDPRADPGRSSHAKMPPTVLVTASLDPIRDGGRAYGAQLILAGSDVVFLEMQGSIHGFTTLRKALPSAQEDMQRVFGAMRLMLGKQ